MLLETSATTIPKSHALRRNRAPAIALLATLVLGLSACGSSTTGHTQTSAPARHVTPVESESEKSTKAAEESKEASEDAAKKSEEAKEASEEQATKADEHSEENKEASEEAAKKANEAKEASEEAKQAAEEH